MRLFRRGCALPLLGMFALPSAAMSQQEPAAPAALEADPGPVSPGSCVLHVWPSGTARSSFMGWFHGGAVDGDRRGIKGYPVMHAELLSTAVQQQLLKTIDWPQLLASPGLSVTVHERPPEPDDDQTRTSPLITGRPACYEEILVHSVLVERAALSANTVRVMVIAKRWRGQNAQPRTYTIMTDQRVDIANEDKGAVETSLKSGFVGSIEKVLKSSSFQRQ
jgi:hypothetical protein